MPFTTLEISGTVLFGLAIIHTFITGSILAKSRQYPHGSWRYEVLHLLGEIEIVFALWAAVFMCIYIAISGWDEALAYQRSLDFTEPFFVFAIMIVCSTRPILTVASQGLAAISHGAQKILRTPPILTDLFVVLSLGPLMGSFITEPAAMTVIAFILSSVLRQQKISHKTIYALVAVLFVNVSIGGALTPFAAPPILMVASTWHWDFNFIFTHFGWKSVVAVLINTSLLIFFFRRELVQGCVSLAHVRSGESSVQNKIPPFVIALHLFFVLAIVVTGHYQNAFIGIFILFLGLALLTKKYQEALHLKQSLLVSVFLGGIIEFGALQKWWLTPLLSRMSDLVLFKASIALTAITDNAALTYLGSQVAGLSDASKYSLVAGAIAGGGLTIIANAPNAAGYSILSAYFPQGIKPLHLIVAALVPTAVAALCLILL